MQRVKNLTALLGQRESLPCLLLHKAVSLVKNMGHKNLCLLFSVYLKDADLIIAEKLFRL